MSTFPSVISAYATKVNGQIIDASDVNNLQSDVTQIENVIGVEGASSVVGTLEYFAKSPASNGGGHVQTANKGGTGQTSFNKGDILVAQSSSVLSKLGVGANGQILVADSSQQVGIKWLSLANSVQDIVVSSVWTKPAGGKYIVVTCVGAGGGGGEGQAGIGGGGGGGGGAIATGFFLGDLISSVAVTVSSLTAYEASGAATVFSSYSVLTANGGSTGVVGGGGGAGGAGGTSLGPNTVAGGSGGNRNGNDGGGGGGAGGSNAIGSVGGLAGIMSSLLGQGGNGNFTNGSVYGGGGGGGKSIQGNAGTGAGGVCRVVTYF